MIPYPAYKVAAARVAPRFLDTDRSVAKACAVIEEAAAHGARLIAFPEAFLPGFPVWAALEAPIRTHELFKALAASAVAIDGPELARLRATARRKGIFVSIGFTEGTTTSVGCLWNANVLIGADGSLLNHHRKLVPTYYEKLILEQEASPVGGAFAVDRAEAMEVPTPFFAEFRRGGDVGAYAGAYTGFLRAISKPVVKAALRHSEGKPRPLRVCMSAFAPV